MVSATDLQMVQEKKHADAHRLTHVDKTNAAYC